MSKAGAFKTTLKNGTEYYRSSITYKNKHISLGSYKTENAAHKAYLVAKKLISTPSMTIDSYRTDTPLDFDKYVTILNFRDNNVYFKNPIYLEKTFFFYYYSPSIVFKFDIDDLFFYAVHKISKRKGHLYVADYGMQVSIVQRYGIRPHAVIDRDYRFLNGDRYDFRYDNIEIINRYNGVRKVSTLMMTRYKAKILVNGVYTIGTYESEIEAAIAYNKAADIIKKKYPERNFNPNYIDDLTPKEYAEYYIKTLISDRIYNDFT